MPGLLVLAQGLTAPAAQARTLRIDTHARLVQILMERHRPGTRYRFGARLQAMGDLDADWIAVRNGALLRQLTWLRSASFSRATLPGFRFLGRLKGLERLDLSKTRLGSAAPLAGLTRLRELDLSGTRVRDLRPLARCTALMDLRLSDTPARDLTPLKAVTLDRLELGSSRMATLPRLDGLAVGTLVLSDAAPRLDLAALAKVQVARLLLNDTGVRQLTGLGAHPTLRLLSLRRTSVDRKTVAALAAGNRALQVVTPRGRTVGRVVTWVRARPRLENYPCLLGTGACRSETFGWERRPVVRWIAP